MITAALILVSTLGAQTPDLNTFLKELSQSRESIKTFRARFIQVVESPGDSFRASGTLVFAQPRRLVYRTNDLVTLVDGGTSYEYEKDLKQVLVDDIAGTPLEDLFFFGFDGNMGKLRERYVLRVFDEPGDPIGRRRLSIRPKPEEQEAAPFIEVIIAFRDKDLLPHQIRVQNDEDASTTYILNTYELNAKLKGPDTEIILPPGTIIVRRGEVVEEVGEDGKRVPEQPVNPDPTLPLRLLESRSSAAG